MRKEVRIESSDYAYLGRVLLWLFLSCLTVKTRNVCKRQADCSVMVAMSMNPAIRLYWVIWLAARHLQTSGHQGSYEPFHTTVSTAVPVGVLQQVCAGEWHWRGKKCYTSLWATKIKRHVCYVPVRSLRGQVNYHIEFSDFCKENPKLFKLKNKNERQPV